MERRRITYALVLGALVALTTFIAAPATSADPSLSLAEADGLELVAGDGDDTLRVTLSNPGGAAITPAFTLVPTAAGDGCGDVLTPGNAAEPVPADGHQTYDLVFQVPDVCVGASATLLVENAGITTVTGAVTFVREITATDYFGPLVAAAVLGGVFLCVGLAFLFQRLGDRTASGDSWSFAGSWLTSISGISTALAGILAASGFIDEVLPGVPLGHFLGLSLTFGLLVLAAPLAFSIFQVTDREKGRKPKDWKHGDPEPEDVLVVNGRLAGVLVAGSLTVAGVAGQLVMLDALTGMSRVDDTSKFVVRVLLVGCAVFLAVYVARSTVQAASLARPSTAIQQEISKDTGPKADQAVATTRAFPADSNPLVPGTF